MDRPGIECPGFVEDAATFLGGGRVVAVPAVAGSGIQVKTLDAIAAGRPTVATTLALRGIDSPPATVRVADEPAEMAAAIGDGVARAGGRRARPRGGALGRPAPG